MLSCKQLSSSHYDGSMQPSGGSRISRGRQCIIWNMFSPKTTWNGKKLDREGTLGKRAPFPWIQWIQSIAPTLSARSPLFDPVGPSFSPRQEPGGRGGIWHRWWWARRCCPVVYRPDRRTPCRSWWCWAERRTRLRMTSGGHTGNACSYCSTAGSPGN